MKLSWQLKLLLLGALWGGSFLFMRETGAELGPFALIFLRCGLAVLVLLPLIIQRRAVKGCLQHWKHLSILGLTNTAIPFCLFAWATPQLGAGYTSIINACAPFFAALIGFVWLRETLGLSAIAGLIMGFAGVVVLAAGKIHGTGEDSLYAIGAALCATGLYGWSANFTRRHLQDLPSLQIAVGSMFYATLALLPFALAYWPTQPISYTQWWQVAMLAIGCTGIAYILFYSLVAEQGITTAMSVTYLVPVFGTLWGVLFVNEQISALTFAGGAMILAGIALNRSRRLQGVLSRRFGSRRFGSRRFGS